METLTIDVILVCVIFADSLRIALSYTWLIRFELSDEDRAATAEELNDPTAEHRLHRRLIAVRLHNLSVPHRSIAQALNLSDDTVTNYLKLYRESGLPGLL
jgi:hypothetical protein